MTNAEIERETGRKVHDVEVSCEMCGGLGGNGWEEVCTACDGEGRVTITVFVDCDHNVEGDDCELEGCTVQAEVESEEAA